MRREAEVSENFLNHRSWPSMASRHKYILVQNWRIFDRGDDVQGSTNAAGAWMRRSDHLELAAAVGARRDINIEDAFE